MENRLKQQMDFMLEIDKLKKIKRQTYLSDASCKENDAEHSWHLAMMCLLLSEYANEEIDKFKAMSMVLIHDIIEIDAGDTYAYDTAANESKHERESEAAKRIFNMLPKDQVEYMMKLWLEFEERKTPEAKFAAAVDNVQPMMLNAASGGLSWNEHGVRVSQIKNRNKITKQGAGALWDYSYYNFVAPNMHCGNIFNDYENIDMTRFELAFSRIREIVNEGTDETGKYALYYKEMMSVLSVYFDVIEWMNDNCIKYNSSPVKWYKNILPEEWQQKNEAVNKFRYDKNYYKTSYANPDVSVKEFGINTGRLLSSVAANICSLGCYCFEQRYFELIIYAELLLEMYDICKEEDNYGALKSSLYYHIYDYLDEITEFRIRDNISSSYTFFTDILDNIDLDDERSIYLYGENISKNEIESYKYINSISDDKIESIAKAFVEGYIRSFENAGIDLTKKETVQIRYPVGFERIIKKAITLFAGHNLKPLISRGINQSGSIDINPQFAYDHRYDDAICYNKAVKDRKYAVTKKAYDIYSKEAYVYAGPAVFEYFGEEKFEPVPKETACVLDKEQQKLIVSQRIELANLTNEYIKKDSYSFTIIAFPVPEIGDNFSEIFDECIKINTLDTKIWKDIQQTMINVLDKADKVHIKGMNGNETDLYIKIAKVNNPKKETAFENCLADCNIPVGEIFTSPVLEGTNGTLNVNKVFINGLEYRNLLIKFENGMTTKYSCSNYEDEKLNNDYIRDNLMNQYESLPMGEFAIGTNTAAYKLGIDYNIQDKLPILIAEKTGPHIAIGDTCYSMSEDIKVFNPDGKEMIAKDNSVSLNRHSDINKAYKGCHTDITIPYNELGKLSVTDYKGHETSIIENGLFVLEGTERLNSFML